MIVDLAAALFLFLALSLAAAWVARIARRPAEARLRSLAAGRQAGPGFATVPFERRVLLPMIESTGHAASSLLPGAFLRRTEQRLLLAGQPMKSGVFYALVLTLASLLGGGYFAIAVAASGGMPGGIALLPGVCFGFLGAYLPLFWLSTQASARQTTMTRSLPDSFDLLMICVEAGLGLDAAFHRVAEKQSGPFADELRQMLREIGLGKTRKQALLDLADRTGLDDVRGFAHAIIQAEQLGTNVGQVLRVQAQRMRVRRRQRAEQEARRAPVKMVFPLVLCLMPSLFIFILGPIIVTLVEYLGSSS